MDSLSQDLRFAVRMTLRMGGLAAVVILTLAIGIAATTTMFSVVYAALMRPVPFDRPDQLAMLNVVRTTPRDGTQRVRWSFPETQRLPETLTAFQSLATYTAATINLTDRRDPEQVNGEVVSAGYFAVLRIGAARGRVFDVADERAGATPVAAISDGLWRRRYGGDPSSIGATIALNDTPLTIVGVLPPGFSGLSGRADVWILPAMAPTLTYAGYLTTPQHFINVIGRLRDDRTLANADAELAAVSARVVVPEASAGPSATWTAGALSLSDVRIDPRTSRQAIVLLAAVACVLLITCVNMASVLLARGRSRRREIAVRLAMGSSRWRIVRQLLSETAVLAFAGGGLGVLLTMWAVDVAVGQGWLVAGRSALRQISDFGTPSMDGAVLLFAVGLSMLTAIACGALPAFESSRADLVPALKEDARSGVGQRHGRLLAAFVVCELAAAVTLLVVAGLLVRSFARMQTLRAGFATDGVVTFWVSPSVSRYGPADGPRIVGQLLDAVQRVPGVAAAGVNRCTPFAGCARTVLFTGQAGESAETAPTIGRHYVSAGYFRALGIPLRAGRPISDADATGRPPVTVINETAARRFWPGENPIGKRVRFGGGTGFPDAIDGVEIVGVVDDVKYGSIDEPPSADFYTSFRQFTYPDTMMIVRTAEPLRAILPSIRTAIA